MLLPVINLSFKMQHVRGKELRQRMVTYNSQSSNSIKEQFHVTINQIYSETCYIN